MIVSFVSFQFHHLDLGGLLYLPMPTAGLQAANVTLSRSSRSPSGSPPGATLDLRQIHADAGLDPVLQDVITPHRVAAPPLLALVRRLTARQRRKTGAAAGEDVVFEFTAGMWLGVAMYARRGSGPDLSLLISMAKT